MFLGNTLSRSILFKVLTIVFFLSGLSGLIYQVAWQRLLTLYYGVGHISITIIVSTFMLGLGLGALAAGRWVDRTRQKLTFYIVMEVLIGIFGILSLPALQQIGWRTAGADYVYVFLFSFLFLLVPTFLMGTTLPVLCGFLTEENPDFFRNISRLYFINTLGAAAGALAGVYVLMTYFGIDTAIYTAAAINFVIALSLAPFRRGNGKHNSVEYRIENPAARWNASWGVICGVVFVTGFLALGYEIVWFRLLSIITKSTPYAFATGLAVYLLGIAFGSYGMEKIVAKRPALQNRSVFFALQFLIAVYVAGSVLAWWYSTQSYLLFGKSYITSVLGWLYDYSFQTSVQPAIVWGEGNAAGGLTAGIDFFKNNILKNLDFLFWPLYFMFVPTLLMGASFPLLAGLAYGKDHPAGRTTGELYFFTVLGNVAGGLVTGLFLLKTLKTPGTLLLFILIGGVFLYFISSREFPRWTLAKKHLVFALTIVLTAFLFPRGTGFYGWLHFPVPGSAVYVEEGKDNVIVNIEGAAEKYLYINGVLQSEWPGYAYFGEAITQLAYARDLKNVLIIGIGGGHILKTVLMSPEVEHVTLVEISGSLIKNLEKIERFHPMLNDPRLRIIEDDGRRYLLRTNEKFDAVLMDPLRITTMYSNNIYSAEFFRIVKQRLKERGILGFYNSRNAVLINTAMQVFPYVTSYTFHSTASKDELVFSKERYSSLLNQFPPDYQAKIVEEGGYLVADETVLKQEWQHVPVNYDVKPRTEYFLGRHGDKATEHWNTLPRR